MLLQENDVTLGGNVGSEKDAAITTLKKMRNFGKIIQEEKIKMSKDLRIKHFYLVIEEERVRIETEEGLPELNSKTR